MFLVSLRRFKFCDFSVWCVLLFSPSSSLSAGSFASPSFGWCCSLPLPRGRCCTFFGVPFRLFGGAAFLSLLFGGADRFLLLFGCCCSPLPVLLGLLLLWVVLSSSLLVSDAASSSFFLLCGVDVLRLLGVVWSFLCSEFEYLIF